jgi:oligopeptide transport system substrate-binding protein
VHNRHGAGWLALAVALTVVAVMIASLPSSGQTRRVLRWNFSTDYGGRRADPGRAFTILGPNLFLGLTRISRTNTVLPGAAEKWEVSDDGLTWTFRLWRNLRWSDGTPLTAHDFEYAWKRALSPELRSVRAFMLYLVKGAEDYNTGKTRTPDGVGVRAVDDYTLHVTLEAAATFFPSYAGANNVFYAVPRHITGRYGDAWTDTDKIATGGPFMVREYRPNARTVMVPNPHYLFKKPEVDEVIFTVVPEAATVLAMYEKGDLDLALGVPLGEVARIRRDPTLNAQFGVLPEGRTMTLGFNVNVAPFNNVRVRQAFAAAVNRDAISRGPLAGALKPANTLVPPTVPVGRVEGVIPFDPQRAASLLAEAGFPGGRGFPSVTILTRAEEDSIAAAEALQAQLRGALSIDVGVQIMDPRAFLDTIQSGRGGLFVSAVFALTPDMYDLFNVVQGSAQNNNRWKNPQFDRLLRQAASEKDRTVRLELYQRAERLLLREAAVMIPLYYPERLTLQKPYVRGVVGADRRSIWIHSDEFVQMVTP